MTSFTGFPPETFTFLKGLAKNNSKDWFEKHRNDYEQFHLSPAKAFVEAIAPGLKKISKSINAEPRVNGSIFRINRDVRFSKDKRPYKTTLDMWFWEGETRGWEAPGFYLRIMSHGFIAGAGLYGFSPAQLKIFRAAVIDEKSGAALLKMVQGLDGLKLGDPTRKKVPRGFDADHPRAQFLLCDGGFMPPMKHRSPRPYTSLSLWMCVLIFSAAPIRFRNGWANM